MLIMAECEGKPTAAAHMAWDCGWYRIWIDVIPSKSSIRWYKEDTATRNITGCSDQDQDAVDWIVGAGEVSASAAAWKVSQWRAWAKKRILDHLDREVWYGDA